MKSEFKEISIRGRVAWCILCLENAIKFYGLEDLNWDFIFSLLWSYTNGKVGNWHYPMAEAMPASILTTPYSKRDMENLTESQYDELKKLYSSGNEVTNFIIDKVFEVGTRDLYSSIVNDSPDTIKYTEEIKEVMEKNKIPLPDISLFKKIPISENEGWGREFTREDLFK